MREKTRDTPETQIVGTVPAAGKSRRTGLHFRAANAGCPQIDPGRNHQVLGCWWAASEVGQHHAAKRPVVYGFASVSRVNGMLLHE